MLEILETNISILATGLSSIVFFKASIFSYEIPLIVLWLVLGALFFTVYLSFINIRGFTHAVRLISGKISGKAGAAGEISHFQALTTAVSGTVGIGNIAGVAIAISLGGAGAAFWLAVAGFLGMSTKFCECTLSTLYRTKHADGSIAGGPMFYLKEGLADLGRPKLGRVMAGFYAGCMVVGCFGIGNMFQSNQAAVILTAQLGDLNFEYSNMVIGLLLAFATGLVIIGGLKSIAAVTSRLVPVMLLIYLIMVAAVLGLNFDRIDDALLMIVSEAFTASGINGGIIGAIIIGFQRAVFSNEAGLGSAAIAHAAAKTDEPVSQGMVALLEPFIDSVVVCTLTSLVIVILVILPGEATSGLSGIEMSSRAFDAAIPGSSALLSIIATLFAFSTMLAWSYYGLIALEYLLGRSEISGLIFKLVFLAFTVIGSTVDLKSVIEISDALVFLISIPNLVGLYFLAPRIKRELQAYLANNPS
jgi:AGCS family alanine or glycine:cation symporter